MAKLQSGTRIYGTANVDTSAYVGTSNNTTGTGGVLANVTTIFIGNNTINAYLTTTALSINAVTTANTTGVYTGVVNGSTLSVGTTFTANATLVNAAAINVVNQTNTATLYVTTSANVGTAVVANATGVYTTGTINAASHTVGTIFNANATALYMTDGGTANSRVGAISSSRLQGANTTRSGGASYYYMDYGGDGTISSADATYLSNLPVTLSQARDSNVFPAFTSSYGSKSVGIGFITGTSSDVLRVATAQAPLYTSNVSSIVFGYQANGPRIITSEYDLSDESLFTIRYVSNVHNFTGSIGIGNNTPKTSLVITPSTYAATPTPNKIRLFDDGANNYYGMGISTSGGLDLISPTYISMGFNSTSTNTITSTAKFSSGQLALGTSDGAVGLLIYGGSKGIRFVPTSIASLIEGVDNTGVTSYQPLYLGGSALTFTISNVSKGGIDSSGVMSDAIGPVRSIPVNDQTAAYQLASTDNGKVVSITTGGVTVNGAVLSTGHTTVIYNNSGSSQTITIGTGGTMYLSGNTTSANRTLSARGVCTLLMVGSNTFVISGTLT